MKREDYFDLLDTVSDDDIAGLMQHRRPHRTVDALRTDAASADSAAHEHIGVRIAAWVIAAALICGNLALGVQLLSVKHRLEREISAASSAGAVQTEPMQTTAATSAAPETTAATTSPPEPVQAAERLYRFTALPSVPRTPEPGCAGGTVSRGNTKVAAFGREFDFSRVADGEDFAAVYCVRADLSEIFWFTGGELYQSAPDLKAPKRICAVSGAEPAALFAIPGDRHLYFYGTADASRCIGCIDTGTGQVSYFKTASDKPVLCRKGILFAHTGSVSFEKQYKDYYYENGQLYRIPLNSAAEAFNEPALSPDGTYLCTNTAGKSSDGKVWERWSVYDVKSGKQLRRFDWTFDAPYTGSSLIGFLYAGIDEAAQSIYLLDKQTLAFYRYDFGG